MEKSNDRLKIHTAAGEARAQTAQDALREEQPGWEALPHPKQKKRRRRSRGSALSIGERLIRNTAIAGALLLCVLAVRQVDAPWSAKALSGLKQAMTMRLDWGERIGKLSFVRALVPETALVFLNLSDGETLYPPVNGEITHGYSTEQPWLEYSCAGGADVIAAAAGRVTAASQGMSGDWVVLIEHDGGETAYGYLADAAVNVGQCVEAGDVIGHAAQNAGRVYFEARENQRPVDPTSRLKA